MIKRFHISKMQQAAKVIELTALGEAITVPIRESAKAKLVSIRLGNRGLELVIPQGAPRNKAYNFLLQKEAWIRKKLTGRTIFISEPSLLLKQITILGVSYEVEYIDSNHAFTVVQNEQSLIVHAPMSNANDVITQYLKAECLREIKEVLPALSQKYKIKMYGKISVKEVISKWGSCSSRGDMVFNWRIILAPRAVFEYVIVHEFCHLKEMHHGREFWQLVEKIFPDYIIARAWLKKHGHVLYQYFPA